jgi:SAM-dependent methyltransferase
MKESDLSKIYDLRFRDIKEIRSQNARDSAWKVLYKTVFKKYVSSKMSIIDLGSGPGYFANQVEASLIFAVDLDANNSKFLKPEVNFINNSASNLDFAQDSSIDLVFSSNLFEHLGTRDVLFETLKEVHRVLRKNDQSKLIILMPNIRYAKWDFYNYIDHTLPLNETSLTEALELNGFKVLKAHKKYFPYSAKNVRIKVPSIIIRIYLSLPPSLRPLAKQMLVIAQPITHKK